MQKTFKEDILDTLAAHGSRQYVGAVIAQIQNPEELLCFVERFTVFNSVFAGGVAGLAGAFHTHKGLFIDSTEPIAACADRNAEIASYIYAAAEDEYLDKSTNIRVTHRALAQVFLKEMAHVFDLIPQHSRSVELNAILEDVKAGYGLNQLNTEESLLTALGFHVGSEILADQEFNLLDEFLRTKYPTVVNHLKGKKLPSGTNAYNWLEQHTYVEIEHFDNALLAVEKTLQYYAGERSVAQVRAIIFDGFLKFAVLQRRFFDIILD